MAAAAVFPALDEALPISNSDDVIQMLSDLKLMRRAVVITAICKEGLAITLVRLTTYFQLVQQHYSTLRTVI